MTQVTITSMSRDDDVMVETKRSEYEVSRKANKLGGWTTHASSAYIFDTDEEMNQFAAWLVGGKQSSGHTCHYCGQSAHYYDAGLGGWVCRECGGRY